MILISRGGKNCESQEYPWKRCGAKRISVSRMKSRETLQIQVAKTRQTHNRMSARHPAHCSDASREDLRASLLREKTQCDDSRSLRIRIVSEHWQASTLFGQVRFPHPSSWHVDIFARFPFGTKNSTPMERGTNLNDLIS